MRKIITTLLAASTLSVLAGGLKNTGFEVKSDWDTPKAHVSFAPDGTTKAFDGAKVAFTGGWSGGAGTYLSQLTDMAILPGEEYVLSAQYAPRGFAGTSFGGVWMRITAAGPKGRHPIAMLRSSDPVSTWTEFKLSWTAGASGFVGGFFIGRDPSEARLGGTTCRS